MRWRGRVGGRPKEERSKEEGAIVGGGRARRGGRVGGSRRARKVGR